MADATTTENGAGGGSKKGKLIIGLAVALACTLALLIGLLASAGPGQLMSLITGEPPAAVPDEAHGGTDAHGAPQGPGAQSVSTDEHIVVLPFQEIIVNITATTATGRQTSRFLKLNLAIVYDTRIAGAEKVESRQLFMRDSFQDYLRQLNESDLQGSIGLAKLKAELLRRARAITGSDAPQEFLIADLIIQ